MLSSSELLSSLMANVFTTRAAGLVAVDLTENSTDGGQNQRAKHLIDLRWGQSASPV